MEWKESFKHDIKTKINHADIEYKKYKKDDKLIYLQQACEKMYSAVENFLMIKYETRAHSYQQLYYRVLANDKDSALLSSAQMLHEFFYNGEIKMLRTDADRVYNSVRDRLKTRLR